MTEKEALKRRLLSYLDIKAEREQIQAELDALADPRGANLDGLPKGSGNGDAMLGVIAQREKLADKYRAKLEELTAAQADIENLIDSLGPRERRLMRYRYIKGMDWETVCVAMAYSWRQTHRLHSQILDKLLEKIKGGNTDQCN